MENMTCTNRRFRSNRGNEVTVKTSHRMERCNGFAARAGTTRTWAEVNGHSVEMGASFEAEASVHAAGF